MLVCVVFMWIPMVCGLFHSSSFRFCIGSGCRGSTRLAESTVSSASSNVTCSLSPPSGLLAIYKPMNWSSAQAVGKVKGIIGHGLRTEALQLTGLAKASKFKIGHGGTLDPLAEGVLVMGVGKGTKIMQDYLAGSKEYIAVAKTGTGTDTLDCTGQIIETKSSSHVTESLLLSLLPKFKGVILQTPPMFSALKKEGKRLYELARKGIEVERVARPVTVYEIELLHDARYPMPEYFVLRIKSSGGFYVRSLLQDLANAMDTTAHMIALKRTQQGIFSVDDCLNLDDSLNYERICAYLNLSAQKINLKP